MPRTKSDSGIACPKCGAFGVSVKRSTKQIGSVRRQRSCDCGETFFTIERLITADPVQRVIDSHSLAVGINILRDAQAFLRDQESVNGKHAGQ